MSAIRGERGLRPWGSVEREEEENGGWEEDRGCEMEVGTEFSLRTCSEAGSVAEGESLEIGENTLPPLESLASRFSTSEERL
mgnify:CR=1 FL=1